MEPGMTGLPTQAVIRIARAMLSPLRDLSALACMGFALIEALRLAGPANVPEVGPWTFLALALVALAVSVAAHLIDIVLSRLDQPVRLDRRAGELGAAARPKVVDLDLYRRLAGRDGRGRHPERRR
jgi:hypothetical protein